MAQLEDVTPKVLQQLIRCARMIARGVPTLAARDAREALRALARRRSKRRETIRQTRTRLRAAGAAHQRDLRAEASARLHPMNRNMPGTS